MTHRKRLRLALNAIVAARPRAKEYTLWDRTLGHFGPRVQPSGAKSFIVQLAQGRMREITLGRFPERGAEKARRETAAVHARMWGREASLPRARPRLCCFRDFAACYRERSRHRWKCRPWRPTTSTCATALCCTSARCDSIPSTTPAYRNGSTRRAPLRRAFPGTCRMNAPHNDASQRPGHARMSRRRSGPR